MHKSRKIPGSFRDREMPAGVANQVNVYFSVCVCVCVSNFPACQDCKNEPETTGPGQALARAHVYIDMRRYP